jgi:hypothetical protein
MSAFPVLDAAERLMSIKNEMNALQFASETVFVVQTQTGIADSGGFIDLFSDRMDDCMMRMQSLYEEFPSLLIDEEAHHDAT